MFIVIMANLANYAHQVRLNKLWDRTALRWLWAFMAVLYIISSAAIVTITASNVLLAIFICLPLGAGGVNVGANTRPLSVVRFASVSYHLRLTIHGTWQRTSCGVRTCTWRSAHRMLGMCQAHPHDRRLC